MAGGINLVLKYACFAVLKARSVKSDLREFGGKRMKFFFLIIVFDV